MEKLMILLLPFAMGESLCSSGNVAGQACIASNATDTYRCPGNSNTPCERINGTNRCCAVEPTCTDRSKFCRFVVSLCDDEDRRETMARECAATCNLCPRLVASGNQLGGLEASQNSSEPLRVNITVTILTQNGGAVLRRNCSRDDNRPKCVFPREKMLTTSNPAASNSTVDSNPSIENYSNDVISTTETASKPPIMETATLRARKPLQTPHPHDSLKKFASERTQRITQETTEAISMQPATSTTALPDMKNSTFEYRKIKLQELMSTKDIMLPRITTETPDRFTISLSKTLIKGTCFDEYVYCREFASLCTHPAFGDVMASHCTMTCKRCEEVDTEDDGADDCVDMTEDCSQYKEVCNQERYLSLTKQYCSKTCGHCTPKCRDRHQNCNQYAEDGFCSDEMYTLDERRHLCGNTCKLCFQK